MNARAPILVALAALLGAFGCGSSSSGNARMSVHLVDGPSVDYREINLDIQVVEIHSATRGWVTLGTPRRVVNLLSLTNGVEETLVDGASLPADTYEQMRLVLGPKNSLQLGDGSTPPLKVPSGQQSGVKFPVSFVVKPNTTADVFIDVAANKSVFVHQAGNSGQYILRPVVHAVDRVVTGAVTGTLTDAQTHAPLAAVAVTAQTLDAGGAPHVVRSTTTATDGGYTLDLLPVGASYFVVAQPVTATASYAALASGPVALSATAPVAHDDLAFTQASAVGGVSGTVTPVAGEADGDVAEVRQQLVAGGAAHTFVVRSAVPAVSASVESYAFDALPTGPYALVVTRSTVDAQGDESVAASAPQGFTVTAGAVATVDVALP